MYAECIDFCDDLKKKNNFNEIIRRVQKMYHNCIDYKVRFLSPYRIIYSSFVIR